MLTQEEASKLINELLFAAQKCRSNLNDSMFGLSNDDPMKGLIEKLSPRLFDDENPLNIVKMFMSYANKFEKHGFVTPMDMYNVIFIAKRETVLEAVYIMLGGATLPTPLYVMQNLERPADISFEDWL